MAQSNLKKSVKMLLELIRELTARPQAPSTEKSCIFSVINKQLGRKLYSKIKVFTNEENLEIHITQMGRLNIIKCQPTFCVALFKLVLKGTWIGKGARRTKRFLKENPVF